MADAIGLIASIAQLISVAIKTVDYVSAVKNAPKEQKAIVQEVLTLVNVLVQLRRKAEEFEQEQANGPWLTAASFLKPMLEALQTDLEGVTDKLLPTNDNKVAGTVKLALWPWKEKQCKELLVRIGRLESLIQIALQQNTLDLLYAVKQDTQLATQIDANILEVLRLATNADKNRQDHVREQILQWLSPVDPFARHETICRDRMPDTGDWFIQSATFQSWLHTRGGSLWCPGIPGAGKTVMMSTVVDYVQSKFENSKRSVGIAHVYFDYTEQNQFRLNDVIRSVYRQVMSQMEAAPDDLMSAWEYGKARQKPPNHAKILSLLEYEANRRDIYVILDALDECFADDLFPLLKTLQDIQPKINLIMSSRPLDTIKHFLERTPSLEISANQMEMERYVRHRLKQNRRFAKIVSKDTKFGDEIARVAVDKAQNMFLLLRLHMDSLASQGTMKAIRNQLARLPEKLDATYDQAMERINAQEGYFSNLAKQSLYWISHASRPLTLIELSHAVAIEIGEPSFDEDNIAIDIDDIASSCAGLVMIDTSDATVRFVHYTTQEYFVRVRDDVFSNAPLDITKKCLTYMLFDDVCSHPWERDNLCLKYPFIGYAACHWGKHARGRVEQDTEIQSMAMKLLRMECRSSDQLMDWWEPEPADRDTRPNLPWGLRPTHSGLHIAASFGLEQILSLLLGFQPNLDSADEHGQTALHWACAGGHTGTVNLLLAGGANPNAKTTWNQSTPLILASARGLLPIVEVLVQRGADVNCPCVTGLPGLAALSEACSFGHTATVEYLLDHAAAIEYYKTSDWEGKASSERISSLSCSMHSGLDLFKRLVSRGANTTGVDGWACVKRAIDLRRPDFILALTDVNADILHTPEGKMPNIVHALCNGYVPNIAAFHLACHPNCENDGNDWAIRAIQKQEWFSETLDEPLENTEVDLQDVGGPKFRKKYKRTRARRYNEHINYPYVGITVPPEFLSMQQITITATSHDQGWSDYPEHHKTYDMSFTWIALSVQFRSEATYPYVEHDLQRNIHASDEWRTHTIVLERDGPNPYVTDTLSRLRPGDMLHIFGRAVYPGWTNYIQSVEVELIS